MSDQNATSEPTFEVSTGPGELKLLVHAGGRTIPIEIDPQKAAALGLALIAGSAVYAAGNPRPSSEAIIRTVSPLPLTKYQAGRMNATGEPVLVAQILGGATIPFRLTSDVARSCGSALLQLGGSAG